MQINIDAFFQICFSMMCKLPPSSATTQPLITLARDFTVQLSYVILKFLRKININKTVYT